MFSYLIVSLVQFDLVRQVISSIENVFLAKNFVGQSTDKTWTCKYSVCPSSVWLDRALTYIVLLLGFLGQCTDRPCTWTDIGQRFDRVWTKIGFPVQGLSKVCLTTL